MYNRSANIIRSSFPVFDLFALNLVFIVLRMLLPEKASSISHVFLFIAINVLWQLATFFNGLYNDKIPKNEKFLGKSVQSFSVFYLLLLSFIFLYPFDFSRLFVLLNFLGFALYLLVSRTIFLGATHYIKNKPEFKKSIVVLGYNDTSKKLVEHFTRYGAFKVDGVFDDNPHPILNASPNMPVLGKVGNCLTYAIDNGIDEIYSTLSPEKNLSLYELASEAERNFIRFKIVPDFKFFVNRNIHIDFARDIPIISLRREPLEEVGNQIQKKIFDVVFSSIIAILVLSWLIPLIALLIKLDSRGPVFFIQKRSGKGNSTFNCIKFRSLTVNKNAHTIQVTKDDERFTTIGKLLRKTNLDEMPQFINVLRGEMSVSGPRPHMLKHNEEYSKIAHQYHIRHFVKPGVTGWAQVNGYRGEIQQEYQLIKRIEHDIWYMENWSMWLDLRIIMLTIYTTLKGDTNAY